MKYEAAIAEFRAAFESLRAWLKRALYCSISTKYLGITAKEPDCYPSNLSVFLKCFVTVCKRGHQSKTAVFSLACLVLILHYFPYKLRTWILKFCPKKSKNPNRLLPSPTYHSWVGEIIWIMIKKIQKFPVTIQIR